MERSDFIQDELITLQDAVEQLGYSREWLERQGLQDSGWVSRQELERRVRESLRLLLDTDEQDD